MCEDSQSTEWKITTSRHKHTLFNEEVEKEWRGGFYFIQGADTQYGLIDRYILKLETPNWDKEIALTEETVKRVNAMSPRPRFFVICGDLCDAFPETQPELRKQQEMSFKRIFSKLDKSIPLVCVCGNHDVGDQPTYKGVDLYRSSFGDDYFSFWCGNVFFIVINSQYYYDGSLIPELFKEQEDWLDKQLELYRSFRSTSDDISGKDIGPVLFQHIPWFLDDPMNRNLGYFAIPYEMRIKMLDKLIQAGVKYVFCGHYHRNSGGYYKGLEVIVTSAIGGQLPLEVDGKTVIGKSGMRVVKVNKSGLQHKYYAIEDLPSQIEL